MLQPEWLAQVPERVGDLRLPEGARVLFTGCGTSFHAALASGPATQALEVVLGNAPEADVLVAVSHEGGTRLTLDGVIASRGGIPLIEGGRVIGAIGCSGAAGSQDEVVCKAGAATIK